MRRLDDLPDSGMGSGRQGDTIKAVFPGTLAEILVAVLQQRRGIPGVGIVAYGWNVRPLWTFDRIVDVATGGAGRASSLSFRGPIRTLLPIETLWKSLPTVMSRMQGASLPRKVTILLRFRFDGEDQGWSLGRRHSGPDPEQDSREESASEYESGSPSGSDSEPARPRESARQLISRRQQVEFLQLVHDGLGRMMACSQMKISERAPPPDPGLLDTLPAGPGARRANEGRESFRHPLQCRSPRRYPGRAVPARAS